MEEVGVSNVDGDFEMTLEGAQKNETKGTAITAEPPLGAEFGDGITDSTPRYPDGKSGLWGAVSNFVNSIVGAGIVGLPFAVAESGFWAGIFMIALAAYLTHNASMMIINAGEKTKRLNYEELMGEVFGSLGFHAFNLFAGVLSFGAMSAYLIIIGDTITRIAAASGMTSGIFVEREPVIILFALLIILPISALKDLSKLSYTSLASVLADLLLVLIVAWTGEAESRDNEDIDRSQTFVFIKPTIFAGFGAISFAFVCQGSSFLVYRSLARKNLARWRSVSVWSVSIAFWVGLVCALAGYLSFVNETEGNILNNFSEDHRAANIARGFLAVTMVLTYPMEIYVCRHVLDASIFQTMLGMGPITSLRHYAITLGLWLLSVILALSTKDLGDIMEVFGALGASAIGYVMPAMLQIQTNRGELRRCMAAWRKGAPEYQRNLTDRLWAIRNFALPFFMVVFGFVAMIAGVATSVVSELHPTKT